MPLVKSPPKLRRLLGTTALVVTAGVIYGCSALPGTVNPPAVSEVGIESTENVPMPEPNDRMGSVNNKPSPATPSPAPKARPSRTGKASWYGPGFHGKKTASGEIFDDSKLTAAHKTLPLGTKAKVTNLTNGKTVHVEINDRGPYVEGRIIDLSRAAANAIEMIEEGTVPVQIDLVSDGTLSQDASRAD